MCLAGLIGTICECFLILHLGTLERPVVMIKYYYQETIGQMVSLGSLKLQHLAKCLLSHCINQQLCHFSAYTLCSFCAKGAIGILFIQAIIALHYPHHQVPLYTKQIHVMGWILFYEVSVCDRAFLTVSFRFSNLVGNFSK